MGGGQCRKVYPSVGPPPSVGNANGVCKKIFGFPNSKVVVCVPNVNDPLVEGAYGSNPGGSPGMRGTYFIQRDSIANQNLL